MALIISIIHSTILQRKAVLAFFVITVFLPFSPINAQECNQLNHPLFEDLSYANSWTSSDGINPASSGFSLISDNSFQGSASGKLLVLSAGAFLNNEPSPISFTSGKTYSLSAWMRSDIDSAQVNMAVKRLSNGMLMSDQLVEVHTEWRYFSMTFIANANWENDGLVEFSAVSSAAMGSYSLFFDQLQFCEEDGLDACNLLDYPGFESLSYQNAWVHYDGGVPGSSYLFLNDDEVYEGRFSARLAINYTAGSGAFLSSNRRFKSLDSLKYYTLSCRIKSSVDSAKLRVLVLRRAPYTVALNTFIELDNEWSSYTFTFQAPGNWTEAYVRFIARNYWIQEEYDIFFDEVKLCESDTPPVSGPGGISQNLALWLKPDELPNRYDVVDWTDRSDSNRHATAIANGPYHITHQINRNSVARFENSNDQLKGDYLGLDNFAQNHSWYVMIKANATDVGNCPIAFSANGYRLEVGNTQNWLIAGTAPFTLDLGGNVEKWNMLSFHSDTNNTSAYINTQQSLLSGPLSNVQGNEIYVLGARDSNNQAWWQGEIAELILYNEVHSPNRRFQIETYFSLKYGLPIPISHHSYYDYTTHPENLAGIGRDRSSQQLEQTYGKSMGPESILSISRPSRMKDGEFLFWGHDGNSLAASSQVPDSVENRLGRSWRIKEIGDVGKVVVSFDMTGLGIDLSQARKRVLLIDKDGDFSDAKIIPAPAINDEKLSFAGVELEDGDFITLGLGKATFPTISPGKISNGLAVWLRADRGISTNVVSRWSDQSSLYNDALAVDLGPRRTLDQINGNPVVRFDAFEDRLSGSGSMEFDVAQHSWYVIANSTGSEIWRNPVAFQEAGYRLEVNGTTRNYSIYGIYPNGFNTSLPADQWQLTGLISGETSCIFYGNGKLMASIPARLSLQGNGSYAIGARNALGNGWWKGDLAEVIVYNRAQDSLDRFAVETYLSIRYGISIPVSTHLFYHHTDHPFNLAGIGQDIAGQGFSQSQSRSINPSSRVRISNPTQLDDGEYLVWGHNGDTLAASNNTPTSFPRRFTRTWRINQTGDVGDVDLSFDLVGLGLDLSDPDKLALLIDQDNDFSDAKVIGNAYFRGTLIHFDGIKLSDGDWFSLAISEKTTSIDQNWRVVPLKIIPNPVSNSSSFQLQFQSPRTGKTELSVLDARGRTVSSRQLTTTRGELKQIVFSTEDWPKGLYFIHLFDGEHRGTAKVLVE